MSLLVTEEQECGIRAFFHHSNWDFIEVTDGENHRTESPSGSSKANEYGSSLTNSSGTCTNTDTEQQELSEHIIDDDLDTNECQFCLRSPCVITDEQSWLGKAKRLDINNNKLRKLGYKTFWTILERRNAWRCKQYLQKNMRKLKRSAIDETVVQMKREIVPECVLTLVRNLFPNPSGIPYVGHCW
ncbi:MAG: hypothetical protein ABW168_17130 [Sedimenticola sp.]